MKFYKINKEDYELGLQIDKLIPLFSDEKWLVTQFADINEYDPCFYEDELLSENIKVNCIIDNNIFRYLLNSLKNTNTLLQSKAAISLLLFAQKEQINFEPAFAIQEILKFDYKNDKAIKDVYEDYCLFKKIDNTNPKYLINYCSDKNNSILELTTEVSVMEYDEFKRGMTLYEKLSDWESLYLLMLKVLLVNEENITNTQKIKKVLDFMYDKYQLRVAVIAYLFYFFNDKKLIKGLNKTSHSKSIEKNFNLIKNMTWDLYYITELYKLVTTGKEESTSYIFATADKCLQGLGRFLTCLSIADEEQVKYMFNTINTEEAWNYFNILRQKQNDDLNRPYVNGTLSIEDRNRMKIEFENEFRKLFTK